MSLSWIHEWEQEEYFVSLKWAFLAYLEGLQRGEIPHIQTRLHFLLVSPPAKILLEPLTFNSQTFLFLIFKYFHLVLHFDPLSSLFQFHCSHNHPFHHNSDKIPFHSYAPPHFLVWHLFALYWFLVTFEQGRSQAALHLLSSCVWLEVVTQSNLAFTLPMTTHSLKLYYLF